MKGNFSSHPKGIIRKKQKWGLGWGWGVRMKLKIFKNHRPKKVQIYMEAY
jgi:hypothetical protein